MKQSVRFMMVFLVSLFFAVPVMAGYPIDEEYFPDPEFRKVVAKFDTDGNGFITPDEAGAVIKIDCEKNELIQDVAGIGIFENLEELSVWKCPLKKLDVSANTKLTYLDCCETGISSLDVSSNPELKEMWAYGNAFTTLDLSHCSYLSKAVKNGIYNNDKEGGTACSFADEPTKSYLVVDKKITIQLADKTVDVAKLSAAVSGGNDSSGEESPKEDPPKQDTPKEDPSDGTGTSSDPSEDYGIGGIAAPAANASYSIGSEILLDFFPTGSVVLGNIQFSGSIKVRLGNTVKLNKTFSGVGSMGSGVKHIQCTFIPDAAGTYTMTADCTYSLFGAPAGDSKHTRTFQVTDPNAPAPGSDAADDLAADPGSDDKNTNPEDKNGEQKEPEKEPGKEAEEQNNTDQEPGEQKDPADSSDNKPVTACEKHTFGDWKIAKKATYTAKGTMERTCSVCGYVEKTSIAKLTVKAGAVLSNKTGSYKILKGLKTAAFVAPVKKTVKTFTIPATVKLAGKTYKVTKIQSKAFSGCKKLTKVVIGKNVTEIGSKAFYKCGKLAKVTIGAGAKTIGKQAFYGCGTLKTIIIKSKNLTAKKTGTKAFQGINAGAEITVPAGKEKAYRSILEKKGSGKKIKVKAAK